MAASELEILIDHLKGLVGSAGFREGGDIELKNYQDVMGARSVAPLLLLRPSDTQQVSAILKACFEANQPIAPQGGMTGLVSGAAPLEGEISLSFERMKKIIEVDRFTSTMTVEAGVELQKIQEEADSHEMLFPLDLGARGSCTIGGNLSTNAGGNRVIRYGMTRDLVIGIEAVLADGTIIDGLHKLRKNNTGYDLKQLFIGSEGTLGVITQAVLKLSPKPSSQVVALCGVNGFENVANLLVHAQTGLGSNLSAFEVIWNNTYRLIDEHVPHASVPMSDQYDFYVLIESMGSHAEKDADLFVDVLHGASEKQLVEEIIIADSDSKIKNIWTVRDAAAEVYPGVGTMHTYDVSLNVDDMGYFGEEVEKRLRAQWPEAILGLFGHIGDGNVHIIIHVGPETERYHLQIDEIIYRLIQELNGAVSAEHGIGLMKKQFLSYSKSESEIALMKALKQTMDPRGILNPGRVF
ncbi:MAG: FAD-binding oxidoreductase [SAR86 cluster bacterium]|uniref:FAD-binding oxidoreductase n=1 Tax=SAR86 cluster bacterium TaxID=2030880 RepID=A0A2A5AD57_9GAMM|nr:MAG: FAD-binding oxidoreductase [SAR86 cluster bacterium]